MYLVEHCALKYALIRSPMGIGAGLGEHLAPMECPDKIFIGDRDGFGVLFANRIWGWRDREAEVFQVSTYDTAVAQRRLEDKQPEEKTNTDCLVKERENVHLGIKVGANITVTGVPGQEGAEGNVAEKKKGVYEN
ncbi:hypothetical protein Tco_0309718 [Tanacetum coccineum]